MPTLSALAQAERPGDRDSPSLARYRPWFYAAALYNLAWGALAILFPQVFFRLAGLAPPLAIANAFWQCIGMFVLVYAPAYWWAARRPDRHPHLIAIALLGKALGPLGFAWAASSGALPLAFGWTILTNDLLWWPAFGLYLRDAARLSGGWRALLRDE